MSLHYVDADALPAGIEWAVARCENGESLAFVKRGAAESEVFAALREVTRASAPAPRVQAC